MYKILVVDDERLECNVMKQIIQENFGNIMEVKTASNGSDAVKTACIWKADLVLLDIEMPKMNGIEAAKKIRNHLSKCIIIFLTAYDVFEYALDAIKIGVEGFLLKPASDEEVINIIGTKLGLYKVVNSIDENTIIDFPCDKTGHLMREIEGYLQKNYMHNISLETVAAIVNLNPIYLSKLFKNKFKINFIDYLTEIRISVAKDLLLNPALTIKEIGKNVGYLDPNYFTKIFKKKVGITPTFYRNHMIN